MNRKLILSAAVGALALGGLGLSETVGLRAQAQPVNPPVSAVTVTAPGAPMSFADVVERVGPAVVSIDSEGRGHAEGGKPLKSDHPAVSGTGSGFFISADGYIATNNHVIDGADTLTVRTKDGRSLPAKLVGRDPATDLAVLRVEGQGFPFVTFEDAAKPRVGDWVIAVGNPFNLGGSATAGIVSGLSRRDVGDSNYVDYMQIDAPINMGNSGGPTFDVHGRVVGVNTMILSPTGGSVGLGFDIPADVAAQVTNQLIASGKVVRGYIGAATQPVTREIADSLGLADAKGALVAELSPGGPSEKAGLKQGDLVLRVDGRLVESPVELTRAIGQAREGQALKLQVRRDGHEQDIVVRSGVRPPEADEPRPG
jgi:serine protease Do